MSVTEHDHPTCQDLVIITLSPRGQFAISSVPSVISTSDILSFTSFIAFQDLIANKDNGETKIRECEGLAEKTVAHTGPAGCQAIQKELNTLQSDWSAYCNQLEETQSKLTALLHRWQVYDATCEHLLNWIKDTERMVKDVTLVATLEEKKEEVKKYQVSFTR